MNTLRSIKCAFASVLLATLAVCASGQTAKPVITKIDPPNWFTQLPDSLLLVHGEHLENAKFSLQQTHAKFGSQAISPNGHWAFLTFATGSAKPGTFEIVAKNSFGTVSVPYTLSQRRPVAEQPKGFNAADVMYLIMPDRFADGDPANDKLADFRDVDDRSKSRAYHGGDLRGIEQHLDYLKQMGVTTIWTTPLYDNSLNQHGDTYHGYSATDMYGVDPHFGTVADYKALSDAAHARGLKIVLDTVPNHVGPATPWAKDPPMPDWLHGTPADHVSVKDDYRSVVDPDAAAARRHVFLDGWFANVLPDLNQDNPVVAKYLVQNAIWWIETAGLDGLRIDTFAYVPRSFWQMYNKELHRLYPKLTDVGEIFNGEPPIPSFWAGGRLNTGSDGTYDTGLDTPFDFPIQFALRRTLNQHEPMTEIADILRQDSLYPHPERLVTFLGNHDTPRFMSDKGATPGSLHLAFGLLATLRGTPQIYYGDELAMKGGEDPDNRQDFPGGFEGDGANAFTQGGRTDEQQQMQTWLTTLLQMRVHTPALTGRQQVTLFADKSSLAFVRGQDLKQGCAAAPSESRVLVVVNDDGVARDVAVPISSATLAGCSRYTSLIPKGPLVEVLPNELKVHLSAQEIGIFSAQP